MWPFVSGFYFFKNLFILYWGTGASQVVVVVKNPPASVGDTRDEGSIPGPGRPPGGGHGHPLQSSCLENPMDRGVWWATVQGVRNSWTRLKWLSTHSGLTVLWQFQMNSKGTRASAPFSCWFLDHSKRAVIPRTLNQGAEDSWSVPSAL